MIGLDTNVIVRYLAQDDPVQSARATRLIERQLSERVPGYVGLVVLVEVCWVLKRLYGATNGELHATVRDFLEARQLGRRRARCGQCGARAMGGWARGFR